MNAEKIAVTGKKLDEKMYYRHSGYPGGLRQRTLREQLERQPTEVLRKAVKGMLPGTSSARANSPSSRSMPARSIHTRLRPRLLLEVSAMATPAQYLGTGKRKTSVARVILRPGDGAHVGERQDPEEYFPRDGPPDARDLAT